MIFISYIRITRLSIILLSAIAAAFLAFLAYVYVQEAPGGLADRRLSKAMGLDSTLSIPLSPTPEEAVDLFRGDPWHIVHQAPVDNGMLVFSSRIEADSYNLQADYVRETWLGWKMVTGGGYGMGGEGVLNYMSLTETGDVPGPYPLMFGEVVDPSVKLVSVRMNDGADKIDASPIETAQGMRVWYAQLPPAAEEPFEIEAYNEEGERIAYAFVSADETGWVD